MVQDLEKRDAQAEKKRESIMVNFNQTKGQLSSIEHAMKSLQGDLENAQFALEVKKGITRCQSMHCDADGACKCC